MASLARGLAAFKRARAVAILAGIASVSALSGCAASGAPCRGLAVLHGSGQSGPQGLLRVREANGGVHIQGMLMGLRPGSYALYVGDAAACGRAHSGGYDVQPILYASGRTPSGPLALFRTDTRGSARIDLVTSELRPAQGSRAVLGHSLLVEDAFHRQDDLRAADPILQVAACGAVEP